MMEDVDEDEVGQLAVAVAQRLGVDDLVRPGGALDVGGQYPGASLVEASDSSSQLDGEARLGRQVCFDEREPVLVERTNEGTATPSAILRAKRVVEPRGDRALLSCGSPGMMEVPRDELAITRLEERRRRPLPELDPGFARLGGSSARRRVHMGWMIRRRLALVFRLLAAPGSRERWAGLGSNQRPWDQKSPAKWHFLDLKTPVQPFCIAVPVSSDASVQWARR